MANQVGMDFTVIKNYLILMKQFCNLDYKNLPYGASLRYRTAHIMETKNVIRNE